MFKFSIQSITNELCWFNSCWFFFFLETLLLILFINCVFESILCLNIMFLECYCVIIFKTRIWPLPIYFVKQSSVVLKLKRSTFRWKSMLFLVVTTDSGSGRSPNVRCARWLVVFRRLGRKSARAGYATVDMKKRLTLTSYSYSARSLSVRIYRYVDGVVFCNRSRKSRIFVLFKTTKPKKCYRQ